MRCASHSRWALSEMPMYSTPIVPAIGGLQLGEQVAQGAVGFAAKVGLADDAIKISIAHAELFEFEQGMAVAMVAQRIELGDEMAKFAVRVNQVLDAQRVARPTPTRRTLRARRRLQSPQNKPARRHRPNGGRPDIARTDGRCSRRWRDLEVLSGAWGFGSVMTGATTLYPADRCEHQTVGRPCLQAASTVGMVAGSHTDSLGHGLLFRIIHQL